MDVKMFGRYVVGLGIFLLLVAGVIYVSNQPEPYRGDSLLGAVDNMSANSRKERERQSAGPVAMWGCLAAFLGVAMIAAGGQRPASQGADGSASRQSIEVPKPSPSQVLVRTPEEPSLPKPDMRQCPHCSKPIAKAATRCGYCWEAVKRVA